ncbi:MAG: hypothetical protein IKZ05_05925 [Clostridia bacterium]|nr:hypothetical protein [Clostridia bacterium]
MSEQKNGKIAKYLETLFSVIGLAYLIAFFALAFMNKFVMPSYSALLLDNIDLNATISVGIVFSTSVLFAALALYAHKNRVIAALAFVFYIADIGCTVYCLTIGLYSELSALLAVDIVWWVSLAVDIIFAALLIYRLVKIRAEIKEKKIRETESKLSEQGLSGTVSGHPSDDTCGTH